MKSKRKLAQKIHFRVYKKYLKMLSKIKDQHEKEINIIESQYDRDLVRINRKISKLQSRLERKEETADIKIEKAEQLIGQARQLISSYEKKLYDDKLEHVELRENKMFIKNMSGELEKQRTIQ